ncbi:MAG: hypothetical protein ACUVTU_12650 [Desulfurispora sp.]|uniref:hypothetical protein n=1 Tax=Desulfurispora sp. TaxID=3014275 RepID=UPI00404902E4
MQQCMHKYFAVPGRPVYPGAYDRAGECRFTDPTGHTVGLELEVVLGASEKAALASSVWRVDKSMPG